ncbi:MAG TPA: Error-prone repair protein ImuA [Flavisolibacter sp.]|nr:Error-prone repair protein ImuA [Flavisolibacter sp.]
MAAKADIRSRLQQEILSLQGFKPASFSVADALGLACINQSFPQARFPFAGVHEFFCTNEETVTASAAFLAGMLASHQQRTGAVLWVCSSRKIFPPALKAFGLLPEHIIFLELKKEKELAWAMEEALKCDSLTSVVGEIQELSFTASRRFQLAIEKSGVGCFVLRRNPRNLATAALTRWQVRSLPGGTEDGLPGVGFPRWQVNLLKVRNGKPGTWNLEWVNGRYRLVPTLAVLHRERQKKTG